MRQPRGTDDLIEIDLIDADPSAFSSRESAPIPERRPRPRWLIATTIGVVAALGATAAVWRPWEQEPKWRTFETGPAPAAVLTERLLLDEPGTPAAPVDAHIGQDLSGAEPTPFGYVFAEASGTYESDRWALFHSRGSNAGGEATPADATYRVQGMNAKVRRVRVRHTITWGPVDGNYWDAETNLLSRDEALRFAQAVGVVNGLPALEHSYRLHDLHPVGDVKTLERVQVLGAYLGGEPVLSPFTPTMLTYQRTSGPLRVASIAIPPDGLAVAEFYFGHASPVRANGMPALLIHSRLFNTMVVWMDGGRLVVIAGQESDPEMVVLANAVRRASPVEWAAVVDAAAPRDIVGVPTPQVTINRGTTADGTQWRASITLGNPVVICVMFGGAKVTTIASCIFSTPISPGLHTIDDPALRAAIVVGVVPRDSTTVLRITDLDGVVTVYEPVRIDDTTAAAAALLPPGATYELVDREN
jgi:hypothetical protein